MKELKVFGQVFLISIVVSVGMLFFGYLIKGGARINFFPGRDTGGGDVFGITILLSSIVGGVIGAVVGALLVVYLILVIGIFGTLKVPTWTTVAFSALIACLSFLLLFIHIWGRNPTYSSMIQDLKYEWSGLVIFFLFGFFAAFLPITIAKKYSDL